MKNSEEKKRVKGLSVEELAKEIVAKSEELMKLRFRGATRQLTQSHLLKKTRRELARLMTASKEKAV